MMSIHHGLFHLLCLERAQYLISTFSVDPVCTNSTNLHNNMANQKWLLWSWNISIIIARPRKASINALYKSKYIQLTNYNFTVFCYVQQPHQFAENLIKKEFHVYYHMMLRTNLGTSLRLFYLRYTMMLPLNQYYRD